MTEATAGRVQRYILDGSDEELRRLLSLSEVTAGAARRAFSRAGLSPGWAAIDCGCGPIGALAVLAEMAGPAGRVVGVDVSELAVMRARSAATALQLGNTEVVAGDIHHLDPAALGGPFDLAFTRLFLMHQADPVLTLRAIARLVRPGGWVIVHEPLRNPPPRSHPPMDALDVYWGMLHGLLDRPACHAGPSRTSRARPAPRAWKLPRQTASSSRRTRARLRDPRQHTGSGQTGRRPVRHRSADHRRRARHPAGREGRRLRVGIHAVLP